jgi:signal transduction histidine kinase
VDRITVLGAAYRRGYERELEGALRRAEEAEVDTTAHRNALAESEHELRLALRQSRMNESLLRTILNTVDIGIAVVDHEATPVMKNSRYQRDLEHATPNSAGGGTDSRLLVYGPDHTTLVSRDIPLLRAARGESFSDSLIWIGPPGDQRALSVSARPVSETGDFTGSVIAYSDVTRLINAVAAKDDFLANVSHELRTPMTSIVGYLDLVLDDPDLLGHIAAPLKVALRNSERLLQLVDDLLATATAGSALEPRDVDLAGLIRESICSAAPRAQGNNVTITTDLPPTLPAVLDPLRIGQVLDNLLSNAIKFSPGGGHVTIAARHTTGHLTMEITDTGIGMTPQDLQEAFTRFFRSDTVRKAAIPGAGLGLPIIRNIIEAHHGTIAIASEPGHGTTVTLTLPARD